MVTNVLRLHPSSVLVKKIPSEVVDMFDSVSNGEEAHLLEFAATASFMFLRTPHRPVSGENAKG